MHTTTHMVTLANGRQVSWDEFSTWSIFKQNGSLFPAVKPGNSRSKYKINRTLAKALKLSAAKKATYQTDRKITRNFGSANGSSKKVSTPQGVFPSRVAASKHFGVRTRKMYDWIQSESMPEFFYLDQPKITQQIKGNKCVTTPKGDFDSLEAAARAFQVTAQAIKNWIKTPELGFSFNTDSEKNNLIPGAKPLMTSAGKFPSLKAASDHFDVQEATIKKWIIKNKPGFYFL